MLGSARSLPVPVLLRDYNHSWSHISVVVEKGKDGEVGNKKNQVIERQNKLKVCSQVFQNLHWIIRPSGYTGVGRLLILGVQTLVLTGLLGNTSHFQNYWEPQAILKIIAPPPPPACSYAYALGMVDQPVQLLKPSDPTLQTAPYQA